MEEKKSSNILGIVIAIIVVILAIWLIVKMTGTKKDDAALNNAKEDIKNAASDTVDGAKDLVNGAKDTTENVKNGIIDAFDLENKENVTIKDGVKTNNSEKFKEEKTFDALTYKNASLSGKNTGATFKVDITNSSDNDFTKRTVVVKFIDSKGNELGNASIEVPNIKKGETTTISQTIMADIANSYDYKIIYK